MTTATTTVHDRWVCVLWLAAWYLIYACSRAVNSGKWTVWSTMLARGHARTHARTHLLDIYLLHGPLYPGSTFLKVAVRGLAGRQSLPGKDRAKPFLLVKSCQLPGYPTLSWWALSVWNINQMSPFSVEVWRPTVPPIREGTETSSFLIITLFPFLHTLSLFWIKHLNRKYNYNIKQQLLSE